MEVLSSSAFVSITGCVKDLDELNLVQLCYDGLDLGSKNFLLLSQLPQKMMLASKGVKSDLKIINLLFKSKTVTHSVDFLANSTSSSV